MLLFERGAFAGDTMIMERREELEFIKLLTKKESLMSKNKTIVNT